MKKSTFGLSEFIVPAGILLTAALLLPIGCAPTRRYPVGEPATSARKLFLKARDCYRSEDFSTAIERLRTVIDQAPRYVAAHRLYQDASVAVRRIEPLVTEYEAHHDRDPDDPLFRYLYGRLQITAAAQEREFRKARDTDRTFAWAWNGLGTVAHQRQKLTDAERYYKKAVSLSEERLREPMIGLGKVYGLNGRYEEAHAILQKAAQLDPTDPLPHVVMAVLYRDQRKYSSTFRSCARAVEIQANYRPALVMIQNLAPTHAGVEDLKGCRQSLRNALKTCPHSPELLGATGLVECLLEDRDTALAHLEEARQGGLSPREYANSMRLLYVQSGRYAEALRIWHEKVPEDLLDKPSNLVANRYRRLRSATSEAVKRPNDVKVLLELARAYAAVGWVKEALSVTGRIGAVASPDAAALQEELKSHLAFCDQIGLLFRKEYVHYQVGRRYHSVERVVKDVEALAAARTGRTFREKTECIDYPFMGRITEHAYPPRSDLMKYFGRFNQLLIMGKPCGSAPVECVLMTVVSREPDRRTMLWGVPVRNERVLAEDLQVTGYQDTLQHRRTGGQTFARFFYTNIDAVWDWCASDIRTFGRLWRPDASYHPERLPPLLIDRMSGEPTRLLDLVYSKGASGDRIRYFLRALNLVDCHEMGHVADAHTHLPLSKFFLRDLALGIQCGFSLTRVLAYTERNAEITALVHADSPRLVLGSMTKFIESGFDDSPHAIGYREITERFVRKIHDAPEAYPEIDTTTRIIDQLTKLPPPKIRSLARELADDWRIPQRIREIGE